MNTPIPLPNGADHDVYYYELRDKVKEEIKKVPNLKALAVVCDQVITELVQAVILRESGIPCPSCLPLHIHTLELMLCDVYGEQPRLLKEADIRSLQKPAK